MKTASVGRTMHGPAVLVTLLVLSIFINYIDRSNLSVAAPLLQSELGYSTAQIGMLSSAFFWTYAGLQAIGVAGWVSDRFNVHYVLTVGFLLWSMATIGSGLVRTFAAFFFVRLLLGAGESLAYPCYSRLIATAVPQAMRGRTNALLDAGSKLGPGLGTLLGGVLLSRCGWRSFFVVLGVAGIVWLVPWTVATRNAVAAQSTSGVSGRGSTLELFQKRSAWGTFLGHFCGNYFWFFLLLWLPTYFVRERGLSLYAMAKTTSLAYVLVACGTLIAGTVSDMLLRRGYGVTRVRKSVVVAGLTGSTCVLPVAYLPGQRLPVLLLYVGCILFGVYTSNHWAITQTLAGPMMAGRWTGIQNGIGNFAGVVAAWLTGTVVDRLGSFRSAFVIAGVLALARAACWGVLVGPVREEVWRYHHAPVA